MDDRPKVTTDYQLFRYITNNRDRNRGHIENIKKAFETHGNLTKVQPILVNDKLEVIDGQHRLDAARELGVEVYYTVVPGLTVDDARQMNILHKTWDTDDYAQSYADGGDANYQRYLDLREEFGFAHSITLIYIVGDERKGALSGFRKGELAITPDQKEAARERLKHLEAAGEYMDMSHQREFAVALLKSMNIEGYDKARMLQKMALAAQPPRYASVLDYQRALEDIYNYRVTDANRKRLF